MPKHCVKTPFTSYSDGGAAVYDVFMHLPNTSVPRSSSPANAQTAQTCASAAKAMPLRTFGLAVFLSLGLFGVGSCAALGQGSSGPPPQKGEPTLSKCVTGSQLEKVTSCAEYCASQNLGCQNYGCVVPGDTKRFGGAAFDNALCAGNMQKGFQCNEPLLGVGAISCCCTGL